jgi:S-disulfanyl-L-cysteine oxidoreductase SoxD
MSIPRLCLLVSLATFAPLMALADGPGLGQPLGADEIPVYARYVMPDGTGLPPGRGTAIQGQPIYQAQCGACHGDTGAEGPIMPPVGPSESYDKPAGRYWPYATTLFDYIRRAMPFDAPKSLSNDEVYAVTAYLLYRNGLVADDAVVDAGNLADVEMPNRDNFIDLWATQGDKPY